MNRPFRGYSILFCNKQATKTCFASGIDKATLNVLIDQKEKGVQEFYSQGRHLARIRAIIPVIIRTANRGFFRWLYFGAPAAAYAALIFFLSSQSKFSEELPSFFGLDKIIHCVEYFIFGALLYRWMASSKPLSTRRAALTATILAGVLYALTDEWHQSFVPGRDASLWDWLFDSFGVFAASFAYPYVWRGVRNL